MYDRAWQVPLTEFVAAWNSASSLTEAANRIRELANGSVPRWAVLARASSLRKDGVPMKELEKSS